MVGLDVEPAVAGVCGSKWSTSTIRIHNVHSCRENEHASDSDNFQTGQTFLEEDIRKQKQRENLQLLNNGRKRKVKLEPVEEVSVDMESKPLTSTILRELGIEQVAQPVVAVDVCETFLEEDIRKKQREDLQLLKNVRKRKVKLEAEPEMSINM